MDGRIKIIDATQSLLVYSGEPTQPIRPTAPIAEAFAPGVHLDRYVIVGRLGAGAMGIVLEAKDPELGRVVALKLVRPRARDSRAAQERLRREAQAMAKLSHPNVASVFDIGMLGEQLFIAMELIRGHTLRKLIGAKHSWRELMTLVLAAGRGLAAAHQAGVVHRDFKPDNVLVRTDGAVRVSDFGLARVMQDGEPAIGGEIATLWRRLLKRASFTSLENLRSRTAAFIEYFNDVLAKPFRWTYTGRPLRA